MHQNWKFQMLQLSIYIIHAAEFDIIFSRAVERMRFIYSLMAFEVSY